MGFMVWALHPPHSGSPKRFSYINWIKYVHRLAATSSVPPALVYLYNNSQFIAIGQDVFPHAIMHTSSFSHAHWPTIDVIINSVSKRK